MENNILNLTHEDENAVVKSFLSKVFTWMLAALVISGTLAYAFANSLSLQQLILQVVDERISFTPFGYIVMFAPLAFILIMNFGMEKLSLPLMLLIFVLFSATMGMSLSTIMLRYSGAMIVKTFFISAATFGIMAFLGATTKTDLSGMGSYLMMGLFGIIIASLINAFTGSGATWIIDILGVIVFTGLTSYKVQMLKTMALSMPDGGEQTQKMAVYGALSLYLTFINLFLTLLRLAGGRR
jgi:FtsH-binding integral membrane protein